MKVKELIKELEKLPQDAPVIIQTNNTMEMGQNYVDLKYISVDNYKKETKRFRDAFDSTNYSSVVYVYTDDKNSTCVKLWS